MFEELNRILNMDFHINKITDKSGLPLYLARPQIYEAIYNTIDFIIVSMGEISGTRIKNLLKQRLIYENKYRKPVVFSFSAVTRYQREVLINNNLPFISLPNHIYMPFFGIALNNTFVAPDRRGVSDSFSPAAQLLFILLAYSSSSRKYSKGEAANILKLTNTSITRASNVLKSVGLLEEYTYQNYKYIRKTDSGLSYIKKGIPYLINPIQKEIYVKRKPEMNKYPYAGEYALSSVSMLNQPDEITRAISSKLYKLLTPEEVDPEMIQTERCVKLQIWKYDPLIFSDKDNIVDRISLYCTLIDDNDERIENETEGLLDNIKWA